MQKVFTGRIFTNEEYFSRFRCLQCGIIITDDNKCEEQKLCIKCKELDLKRCEGCTILCREGLSMFYNYDSEEEIVIKERKKNKRNKTGYKEFLTAEMKERETKTLCKTCIDWKSKVKDVCFDCGRSFDNTPSHYKSNGNYCISCVRKY